MIFYYRGCLLIRQNTNENTFLLFKAKIIRDIHNMKIKSIRTMRGKMLNFLIEV